MMGARALLEVDCMKIKTFLVTTLLASSLGGFFAPRESFACSNICVQGAFSPTGGNVPASMPAIVWEPRNGVGNPPSGSEVGLFEVTSGGETPLGVDVQPFGDSGLLFLVVPTAPLMPNTDYIVRDKLDNCQDGTSTAETKFHTTDAAPFPTKLGTIIAVPASDTILELPTFDGSCSIPMPVLTSAIELVPSEEALPFADAFYYETIVDGMLWQPRHSLVQQIPPGASWEGRRMDRLYTLCGENEFAAFEDALAEGDHTVLFRASLPGSNVVLESEVATVSLHCKNLGKPPMPTVESTTTCSAASANLGERSAFFTTMVTISTMLLTVALKRRRVRRYRA
jgi:hypothetical protein